MSFASKIATLWGKTPVRLMQITRDATTWRYHVGPDSYVYGGQTFAASSLSFEELNFSSEARKDDFTVDGFALSDTATQTLIQPAEGSTTLILRRGFVGDAEFITSPTYRMSAWRSKGKSVSLVFSGWADDLGKRSPGFVAQRQCPYTVYGPECGLSLADWQEAGTCASLTDGVAYVAEAASHANGFYFGGLLTFNGVSRTIVKHQGSELTLSSPFPALAAAVEGVATAAVLIAPGCDKSLTTNLNRFDNIEHYGGFPQMGDSPFQKRVF